LILFCAIVSTSVQADLFFFEPFSESIFPEGFLLGKPHTSDEAKNGWTSGNSASDRGSSYVSSSAALSYEGLAAEPNSHGVVRTANTYTSNRNAGKPFGTTIVDGSVYCSFLMKVVSLPTEKRCLLSLNHADGSSRFNKPTASVWLDSDGCLLIGKTSDANTPDKTASIGDDTVFVVLKYSFKEGQNNDEVALYVNPKPGQSEPTQPVLLTSHGEDARKLMLIGLPQNGVNGGHGADSGQIYMDEIRVGTQWADVTPAAKAQVVYNDIAPADLLMRYAPKDEVKANKLKKYLTKELGEIAYGTEGTGTARTITKTIVVPPNVTYDGKGEVLTADAQIMGGGDESENQKPLFLLAPGAGIKNVTITVPGCEGIHMMGDNVLDNIHWQDVGEDAASVRSYFPGGKITIKNSQGYKAADKMFQFNTICNVRIENFVGDDMGKLIKNMWFKENVPFYVDLNDVKVTNVRNAVVQSENPKCQARYHNLSYKFSGRFRSERVFRNIPPENVTEY
jgi:hypothetical protein